jgi:hypothetical protein
MFDGWRLRQKELLARFPFNAKDHDFSTPAVRSTRLESFAEICVQFGILLPAPEADHGSRDDPFRTPPRNPAP